MVQLAEFKKIPQIVISMTKEFFMSVLLKSFLLLKSIIGWRSVLKFCKFDFEFV